MYEIKVARNEAKYYSKKMANGLINKLAIKYVNKDLGKNVYEELVRNYA